MNNANDNHDVKVLLLAGGLGTRLRPITDSVPKCLVPIANRPLLDYWFDRFAAAGLRDVRINNHHLPDQVRDYIQGLNQSRRFNVSEAFEPELLGSAGTIHANRDLANGSTDCIIAYADNLSDINLQALIDYHRSHNDPFTMMLFHSSAPEKCGIVEMNDEQQIINFNEKPEHPKSDLANAGVYVVTAETYREIADMNEFDLGFNVLPRFVGRMRGFVWPGYHLDIGTYEALAKARADAPGVFNASAQGK